MKYALIGCGRISVNHISAAINNGLEIVGLCDILEEKTKEKKEMFQEIKSVNEYTDYKKMIAEEKPELVAIATESGKHAKIAIYCLENGCNVIIEKPIALSLEDADKIIKAGEKNNLKVCACHQNRFNKAIQKIRTAIETEKFGRIFNAAATIRWNRNEEYYVQAPWRGTWEQDGGCLMNQCIHNIDLIRWMMGNEIDEVFAYTANLNHNYLEVEDLGVAVVKFKNGGYATIEGTTNVFPKNLEETLYVFGEKGTVKIGGSSVNKLEVCKFTNEEENEQDILSEFSEEHKNVYGLGHGLLYKDVINSIKENREPYVDGYAGRRALELVLGIYKSAKEKRPIKFPLKNVSTLDFTGLF